MTWIWAWLERASISRSDIKIILTLKSGRLKINAVDQMESKLIVIIINPGGRYASRDKATLNFFAHK